MPSIVDHDYIFHEIKTPLSVINGYAQLALECGNKDESLIIKALQSIIDETGNILWMIQSMKTMDDWDRSKTEKLNLSRVVEEAIKEYSALRPCRIWQFDCSQDIFVNISYWGIKGAIRSLYDNAIKYTQNNGLIKTEVYENNKTAFIRVIDDGIGIPEKEISHIFDLRYRAYNVTNIEGSGIGLYHVKKVVERNNGTIMAESLPCKGSRFVIQLPCA